MCFTVAGIAAGPPPVLDLTKELTKLSSTSVLFEVVADDLQTLNKNLQSVSFMIGMLWKVQFVVCTVAIVVMRSINL